MKRVVIAIISVLMFANLTFFLNVSHADVTYFDDFEPYGDDATSFSGDFWEGDFYNDSKIDDGVGVDGSKGANIYMNWWSPKKLSAEFRLNDLEIEGFSFMIKMTDDAWIKIIFYDKDDNEVINMYWGESWEKYFYFCGSELWETTHDKWITVTIFKNDSALAWDVKLEWDTTVKQTTSSACSYVSTFILSKIKILTGRAGSNVERAYLDNFTFYAVSIESIPEYSGYLKIGGVDTSTFYSTSYKYAEYKRWVYMSGIIIKHLDIAFDENENLSSVDDIECVLCGINIGKPNSVKKYVGSCNYVWLAEWDGLNIELNGYLTIELKRNGQNFNGLGVWSRDIDSDGQQNLAFHNNDGDYGNGIAPEGINNILYDLAYRIYYVYKEVTYEDSLLLNAHTVYVYDTLAIRYTCAEDDTRLIILKPDSSEAVNVSVSSKGTYYYTPAGDTGTYEVHLYRDGTYVCNDTFIVLSSGAWGVWVDKNDVNVGETVTIYYNTNAPGIVDTGVNEYYVNGTGRIYERYYNRGQYTVNLYKLINGTMYLMDSEIIIVGSTYFTDTLNAYPKKAVYGHVVYLCGTTEHLLYSPYLVVHPENKIIPIDDMEFNITFYPQKLGDHYVIMRVGNRTVAETSFIVVSEGAVRYELKYLVSLIFIIICAVLGITITSHFNLSKDVRAYVIIIFIFIGISTTALMNLLPLWVPFMLGLITVVWIIWKVVK